MRFESKRGLVATLIALYILWIPVHFLVAQRFEINPWKLCGLAMYATPQPRVAITLFEVREGGLEPLWIEARVQDQQLYLDYMERRRQLGHLAPPDGLAEHLFALKPDVDHLAIVITRTAMNADAILADQRTGYEYRRDEM